MWTYVQLQSFSAEHIIALDSDSLNISCQADDIYSEIIKGRHRGRAHMMGRSYRERDQPNDENSVIKYTLC